MAQGNDQDPHKGFSTFFYCLALLAMIVIGMWFVKRAVIVDPAMALFWLDYQVGFLVGGFERNFVPAAAFANMAQDYQYTRGILVGVNNPTSVTLGDLTLVGRNASAFTAPFGAALLMVLAVVAMTRSGKKQAPGRQFSIMGFRYLPVTRLYGYKVPPRLQIWTKRLKMPTTRKYERVKSGDNFMEMQSRHWRHTITSVKFNVDLNDPNWAPPMTPLEWCLKNGVKNMIDHEDFERCCKKGLMRQIGRDVESIDDLPTHARAILALCWQNLTIGNSLDKGMFKLAGDLAELALPHQPFPEAKIKNLVDPVLRKSNVDERTGHNPVDFFNDMFARHTGWKTGMVACVGACGPFRSWGGADAGIIPPTAYLWLKGVDRSLWYTLVNVGSPNYRIEGEGAIAQFWREKFAGKRMPIDFSAAIKGIKQYFDERGVVDLVAFSKEIKKQQI
jgi:hypothetical protein